MIEVSKISPKRDLVIVKVKNLQELYNELITPDVSDEENISIRFGEVIAVGPDADNEKHCPGLKESNIVVFTEFAGYFIPTKDDNLYKVIRGYDIIGKFMNKEEINNRDSVVPTGDRLLVELIDLTRDEDGVILGGNDPRLADLSYGKILKINPKLNKSGLKVGQRVAFSPHVGTDIRNYESDEKKALKIIVEYDILFTV